MHFHTSTGSADAGAASVIAIDAVEHAHCCYRHSRACYIAWRHKNIARARIAVAAVHLFDMAEALTNRLDGLLSEVAPDNASRIRAAVYEACLEGLLSGLPADIAAKVRAHDDEFEKVLDTEFAKLDAFVMISKPRWAEVRKEVAEFVVKKISEKDEEIESQRRHIDELEVALSKIEPRIKDLEEFNKR